MSEIGTLSLERLNNGAHFLFISNVLARAEADASRTMPSTQRCNLTRKRDTSDY